MDKQITGLAGEYFVAAELLKRGWQVAMTLGNAKSIDLIATKGSDYTHRIQVKTLRKKPNCFSLNIKKVSRQDFYIFVYLNGEKDQPEYFIVKGAELLENCIHYWGASLGRSDKRETVNHGPLQEHKDCWDKMNI